jgi:formylglycine-generating enzyme required for sulfatase activity
MESAVDLGLPATSASSEAIAERYRAVRGATERLCAPLSPEDCGAPSGLSQMLGDVWEWTQSDYAAYPGFSAHSRPVSASTTASSSATSAS